MPEFFRRLSLLLGVALLAGCRQDMHDQPRYEALEGSSFFGDARASRPQIPGTVARGQLRIDQHLYTGKIGNVLAATLPFAVTREVIERGRDRFNIHCTPCHDRAGTGQGIVVQRGFRPPPSFHTSHLREAPVGHFFDVMTNGFGAMSSYATRVSVRDRWAIAAYLRALQYSQYAPVADVPADKRAALDALPQPAAAPPLPAARQEPAAKQPPGAHR